MGDKLFCKEKFTCYSCSGNSKWIITVPENTIISFSSSSGDFEVKDYIGNLDLNLSSGDIDVINFEGEIDFRTSSGDVSLDNVNGDLNVRSSSGSINAELLKGNITLRSSSGNIDIKESEGVFELRSSSGDVDAKNVVIKSSSHFSTSSGNTTVILKEKTDEKITVKSSSGDAILDYNK